MDIPYYSLEEKLNGDKYNVLRTKQIEVKLYKNNQTGDPFWISSFGGYENNAPGYFLRRKDLLSVMFNYTISGKAILQYRGKKYLLKEGDLCIIDMSYPHTITSVENEGWEIAFFHSATQFSRDFYLDFIKHCEYVLHNYNGALFIKNIKKIYSMFEKNELTNQKCFPLLNELYMSIGKAYMKQPVITENRLKEIVVENLSKPINEIADIVGYSTEHFIRLFKAQYRITPHNFQTITRISQAMDLIRTNTEMSLDQIARACGFPNVKTMTYSFEKHIGISPKDRDALKVQWGREKE